jgi:RHS repeat-associated protein
VTALRTPSAPGVPTGPVETPPAYTVSWAAASGTVSSYALDESLDEQQTWTTTTTTLLSQAFTGKSYGRHFYRIKACNALSCGPISAPSSAITVVSNLAQVADATVPAVSVPPIQYLGTLPGNPSTDGGAASYHIPIEVPPGRQGMQPDLALSYSSRGGNGHLGVGWSLSAPRTIQRCPRLLSADGANRPVLYDSSDKLCFDGQRLIGNSSYGQSGAEYRTEIDSHARIIQQGDINSWGSSFTVETQSGRYLRFSPKGSSTIHGPDTWYLDTEADPVGNCVSYLYQTLATRGTYGDSEQAVSIIYYTGIAYAKGSCSLAGPYNAIYFDYADRPDRRTTYRAGAAEIATQRLVAIRTVNQSQAVRRYELSYHPSAATNRSLLDSVRVCAGSTSCTAAALPATTFAYQEDQPNFTWTHLQYPEYNNGIPLDASWHSQLVGDIDGDGTRDQVLVQSTSSGQTKYLRLSYCGNQGAVQPAGYQWGMESPPDATAFQGEGDVTFDGHNHVAGQAPAPGSPNVPMLAFWHMSCLQPNTAGISPTAFLTDLSSGLVIYDVSQGPTPWPSGTTIGAYNFIDFNGDGILDVQVIPTGTSQPVIVQHTQADPAQWFNNHQTISLPASPSSSLQSTPMRDYTGDGRVDFMFDTGPSSSLASDQDIQFIFQDPTGKFSQPVTLSALGGPSGCSQFHPSRRWLDVNGDGLPDLYGDDGYIYINQGGQVDTTQPNQLVGNRPLFVKVPVTSPPPVGPKAQVLDIDSDGRDDFVIPMTRIYNFCATMGYPAVYYCAGDTVDPKPAGFDAIDQSVYQWTAYRLVENADGSYSGQVIPQINPLQAPLHTYLQIGDWNGDGMVDVRYTIGRATYNPYNNLANADEGAYLASNSARAPDLLVNATNGLGATAAWYHQPLTWSYVPGCDVPQRFYQISNFYGPRSLGYAYFSSSMWTAARMDVSNGIGSATNRTCYRYQDAMVEEQGRGFQGFKSIIAEEQIPPAAGESGSTTGCPSSSSGCSVNNLRTTTTFYQEFPLTNRINKVTVALAATGAVLNEATYRWDAQKSAFDPSGKVWLVAGTGVRERKYELPVGTAPPVLISERNDITVVDPMSGVASQSCSLVNGATPQAGSSTLLNLIQLQTRTLTSDPRSDSNPSSGSWWLGRVDGTTTFKDSFTGTFFLSQYSSDSGFVTGRANQTGINCNADSNCVANLAAAPSCPVLSATATNSVARQYTWLTDGSRKPWAEQLNNSTGGVENSTTYSYDNTSWKNASAVLVAARDADINFPPSSTGLISVPATLFGYTPWGYFRTTVTNALNHTSTSTFDPATGKVTSHQEVQNGPWVNTLYDALGGVDTVATDCSIPGAIGGSACGAQPASSRLSCYPAGACLLKRQTFQAGSPIKTEYMDVIGRVIATGVEGIDTYEILTKITYNARGKKIAESAPLKGTWTAGGWDGVTSSSFGTQYSSLDAYGRPALKTLVRDPSLCEPGQCDAQANTHYAYSQTGLGSVTSITADKAVAVGGSLVMSRTYDLRGKLIQTTQNISGRVITTSYYYDPAGNLLSIVDTKNNSLSATYDNLGRKLKVIDPDRGTWNYTWDGLSRLRTQVDGKTTEIDYQYDWIGRLQRRFKKEAADASAVLDASWVYDPPGQPGVVSSIIGADNYRRDILYDERLRPFREVTSIPADPGGAWSTKSFTVERSYDRNLGRPKAMSYPSGEWVAFDYDGGGRSYPVGETQVNPDYSLSSTHYRRVTSLSPRGQTTQQTFGNGVQESLVYEPGSGLVLGDTVTGLVESGQLASGTTCTTPAGTLVHSFAYTYDQFLNLARQTKQIPLRTSANGPLSFNAACATTNEAVSEVYAYDDLQRLLSESRSWQGNTRPAPTAPTNPDSYSYDDLGNITSKSDYASSYTYGTGIAPPMGGPHAVMSLSTGATYQYDGNGNMTAGDGRSQTFDYLDRPTVVTKDTTTTKFRYAPDGSRYLQYTVTSSARTATYYVDKFAEHVTSTTISTGAQSETDRSYVGPAVVITNASGVGRAVNFLHLDRLGSVQTITGPTAAEAMTDAHGMDAFGKPRDREWMDNGSKLHPSGGGVTNHGFTGHEHLDDTYLIHMNGRVYDYRLGRFLSVDPIISNPANSQSINPYSYIGNNPLSGTDPTGYDASCVNNAPVCKESMWKKELESSPSSWTGNNPASTKDSGAAPQGKTASTCSPADTAAPAKQANDQNTQNGGQATAPGNKDDGSGGKSWWERVKDWYRAEGRLAEQAEQRRREELVQKLIKEGRLKTGDDGTIYLLPAMAGGPRVPVGRVVGEQLDPAKTPIYRGGGTDIGPNDIRLSSDGTVKQYGPSLGTDAAELQAKYGSVRQIKSVPEELQIVQTGRNPNHYEIVPRTNNSMTPKEFLEQLNRVEYHSR